MVQVDVFWSYGIGAGFALAAANQLRSDRDTGPYLTATAIYAAAVFGPSGAWLLWQFTSWETMHTGTHDTVPGWLVALFTATNTTQAILGFLITRWLLDAGRFRLACLQAVGAYFAMFFILVHGWDGTGYQRFFSPTAADFGRWTAGDELQNVRTWLTSDVALTLYGMGVVLVPIMLGLCLRWHLAGVRAAGAAPTRRTVLRFAAIVLGGIFGLGLGGAIAASVLIHLLGWLAGGAAFALAALAVVAPRRGIVGLAARQLVRIDGPGAVPGPA